MNRQTLHYTQQSSAPFADLSHIPGEKGLPVFGKTLSFYKDFNGTLQQQYQQFGSISKLSLGFQNGVLVLGADNVQEILLDKERNFSNKMGYEGTVGQWFTGGLLFHDFNEHRVQRRVFQTAFKFDAMRSYVPMMNDIIERKLENWDDEKDFTFVPHIQQLLMNIGARVFYGVEDLADDSAKKMAHAFTDVVSKGMMSLLSINLPPFKYYYGKKGRAYIDKYIGGLIAERRAGEGKDFMSYLVKEKKEDGEYFSDQELIGHLFFLFFAAYDTTTTALSHLVMHLAEDQDLQEKLRQECLALGKAQADFDDLEKLAGIDRAFHESLRLYPSASIYMRRAIKECEIDGVKIPANTVIFMAPAFNHRLDAFWSEPEKFDPERFSEERLEQKNHSFSYIPFGGGAHKCIGMNFAQNNAKLFMCQFLLRYRFKTPDNYQASSVTLPLPKPVGNLPLVLEKIVK